MCIRDSLITIAQAARVVPGDATLVEVILDLNRDVRPTSSMSSVTGTTPTDTFQTATLSAIGSTYTISLPNQTPPISLSISSVNETLTQFIPELIIEFNDAAATVGWTMSRVGTTNTVQIASDIPVTQTNVWTVVSEHGTGDGDIEFGTFAETQNGNEMLLGFGDGVNLVSGVAQGDPAFVREGTLLSQLQDRASKTFYRNAASQLVFIEYRVDWDSTLRFYRRFNRTGAVLTSIETFVGGTFDSTALTLTGGTLIPQGTKTFTRTDNALTSIAIT